MNLVVFQGLSAAIIWRQIAKIRKFEFDKSVHEWVTERAEQRADRSDREESKSSRPERSAKRTERSHRTESSPWMSKRSTKRAERSDGGESSRVKWPFFSPKKEEPERCACCPDFDFGCLQKLEIVDEDEDDYD